MKAKYDREPLQASVFRKRERKQTERMNGRTKKDEK